MSENKIIAAIKFDHNDAKDMNTIADYIRDELASSFVKKTICDMANITPSKMSLEERLSLSSEIENKDLKVNISVCAGYGDDFDKKFNSAYSEFNDILKAAIIFEVLGFNRLADQLRERYAILVSENLLKSVRDIANVKKIISEDRSKAKKGKTNRHKSTALSIACNTWKKYPNASLPGLSAEIYAHLRNKWNDVPVVGTIERWLKESGMNPKSPQKNRDFKLVIGDKE